MHAHTLSNCEKALTKLNEFTQIARQHQETDVFQAAVIQAFEYTFEVFWKTFQKIGQGEGVTIGSPKSAFKFAFQSGLLSEEQVWLDILNDRNMTTHTYHEQIAQQIYARIKNQYVTAFQHALASLKEHGRAE